MRHLLLLPLVLTACGVENQAPRPESELDYHVIATYSQNLEVFLHDQNYSADAIANALKKQPIHYYEQPEGWTYLYEGMEANGRTHQNPDGSWRIECVPSVFVHEFAHYLMGAIGGVEDPTHHDLNWWGYYGVVRSMTAIAAER